MTKRNLFDIYYVRDCDECMDIIFDYGISRQRTGHDCVNENEGLEKLIQANITALDNLIDDIYYEERILIEAITFLQYLLCFQKKPNVAWLDYYKSMLRVFHRHKQLLYKKNVYTPRNYWKKKDCAVIMMLDNETNLHYKTAKELSMDFGKYRAELIVRTLKKQQELYSEMLEKSDDKKAFKGEKEDWKKLSFSFILGTIL